MMEHNFEEKVVDEMMIDQAYQEAKRINERDEIKIESFSDLYKDIDKDAEYVRERERKFKEEMTPEKEMLNKIATVFELIIYTQGNKSEWFGKNAWTIKTSRYDDIKNKIDTVVEFRGEPFSASYLGLAVDATMSSEVDEKLDEIKREIDKEKLSRVKYFKSDHTNHRGEISKIPRVIVAANQGTIRKLTELWLEKDNQILISHPIQFQILEEILLQLKTFKSYAETNKKGDLPGRYNRAVTILNGVLAEKRKVLHDNGERDSAFYAMEARLKYFGGQPKKDTIRVARF